MSPDPRASLPKLDRTRVAAEVAALGHLGALEGVACNLLGRPTACIGRDDEVHALLAWFDGCVDGGESRAAVVSGPPGVGKSRVVVEFLRAAKARAPNVEVLIARGDPMSTGSAFGMVATLLRREARILDGEPTQVSHEKIRARVAHHLPMIDVARVSFPLAALAKIGRAPSDDRLVDDELAAEADAVLLGDQMRRAWEDFLAAECADHPVILVLEDFHWGDRPTASFVDSALRALDGAPLFVLAVGRPEVHYLYPQLWGERRLKHFSIEALSRAASEEVVRQALGDDATPARIASLTGHAAGNAFHLEELIRAAARGDEARPHGTAHAMVRTRLDAQELGTQRTLRAASVFGHVFWTGGVVALLGGPSGTPGVRAILRELEGRELIARRPSARFPYEDEYVFRHAIIQEAAYAALTDDDRAQAHLVAAEWLERMGESDAMVLAEHFERGRAAERAVAWYGNAAEKALQGNDLEAAIERAERGVVRGAQGDTLGALKTIQAEAHQWRGRAEDALECAFAAMTALPPASAAWFRPAGLAITALQALGNEADLITLAKAMLAALPSLATSTRPCPPAVLTAAVVACIRLYYAGHSDLGDAFYARIEAYALHSTDPAVLVRLAQARAVRSLFGRGVGDLPVLFEHAAVGFDRIGDLRNANNWRANVGYAYLELGLYDEAEKALRGALAEAQRLGLDNTSATCRHNLGLTLARIGGPEALREARAHEEAALARYVSKGDLRLETAARIYLALIMLAAGDVNAAAEEASRAVSVLPTNAPVRVHALAALAHVELARGRAGEALAATCEGVALLDSLARLEGGEALLRLSHAEALRALGYEEGSNTVLRDARKHVLEQARRIENPAFRKSFLENVPENARTLELSKAHGVS